MYFPSFEITVTASTLVRIFLCSSKSGSIMSPCSIASFFSNTNSDDEMSRPLTTMQKSRSRLPEERLMLLFTEAPEDFPFHRNSDASTGMRERRYEGSTWSTIDVGLTFLNGSVSFIDQFACHSPCCY